MEEAIKKSLYNQGYRFVGEHSAVKICLWCKKAIRNQDSCYKHKFYGIESWRCVQASVTLDVCNHKCSFCWRDLNYTNKSIKKLDEPKEILDGLIKAHKEVLQGFWGSENIDKVKLKEAMAPKHIALSLTGETCLYNKLPELVDEIHKRKMTCFVVTNGTVPGMLKKLIKHKPTQLYITLAAPDKEVYSRVCNPVIKNGWENIQKSLNLLGKFERGTVRLTLAKDMNFLYPEKYAEILKNVKFKFLEVKAAMSVGYARQRMEYKQMPFHEEIKEFAKKIGDRIGWKIVDEQKESRVVLLMKEDKDRKLRF